MFPRILRVEIIALLAVKAAALTVIYFLFIAPNTAPEPDAAGLRAHLLQPDKP
jgi:hypothetical protein